MTIQQAACLALFSHCQTEPLPGLLRSDQSGRQTEQVQDSPSRSTTPHPLAQDPLGQMFPAGLSPQTPPPWSLSHGSTALPVLLSRGLQADGQIRVQALRGVQKSPSQDHHPVYGRPSRPQNLPCHAIRLHRSGFCWSLRCQKRSHQETYPSQSLCLPLSLYEHQSSAHRLHRRPQHSFLHAVL